MSGIKAKTLTNIVLNNFKNDSRVLKTSRSLAANGLIVRVVALHDNSLPEFESMHGFEVVRVKLLTNRLPANKISHLFKYLEFTLRVLMKFNDTDLYHCNDLHTLPAGMLIKLFSSRGVKIIYDAHEYETESRGINGLEKIFRRWLEGFLIRYADKTVTVSDSIATDYAKLYDIEKPTVILNMPLISNVEKHDLLRQSLGIGNNKKIFLYQGGLVQGRGIEVLMDTFEQLEKSDNVIVFMGYGYLEGEVKRRSGKSNSIFFHEAVPPDQIPIYTSSADVGISTIENICLSYYYCLPNKLFEYLMAEIPVIVSNLVEMAKLVTEHRLGIVATENTVAEITQAVTDMDQFDQGEFLPRVRQFKQQYNWEAQEAALIKIYADL